MSRCRRSRWLKLFIHQVKLFTGAGEAVYSACVFWARDRALNHGTLAGTISARRLYGGRGNESWAVPRLFQYSGGSNAQRMPCFSRGGRNAGAASRSGRNDEQGNVTAILQSGQQHRCNVGIVFT
jgi:hypothetical protein